MPKIVHGGFSIKKPARVKQYATAVRKALVQDISGGTEEDLSAQKIILIDSVVDSLVIVKMMGEYIAESGGVMAGSSLKPCLRNSWLAYRNSISRHLALLGLEKSEHDNIMTPAEVAADIMKDKEKEKNNG